MSIEAHKALIENKALKEIHDLKDQIKFERIKAALAVRNKDKARKQRDLVRMQLIATRKELAEKKRIIGALEKENLKLRRSILEAGI